jgi:AraC-like DNA-binding protein
MSVTHPAIPTSGVHTAQDALGCTSAQLSASLEFAGSGIRFYRKRSDDARLGHVATSASDRGFLVGVSQMAGHRRRILQGRRAEAHAFGENAIYVRNFGDDYRADMQSAFDFLLLEISHSALAQACGGRRRIDGLTPTAGTDDPVLVHLVRALAPALERPGEASPLFVDQLALAIGIHLSDRYGGVPATSHRRSRALAPAHEARAKEMLRSRMDGRISIAEVADACHLSRSHFARAFRETTGLTPIDWLQAQRIARARELLRGSDMPLAEVATACGFADQSHFTRVFSRVEGAPPGHWRRVLRT